MKIDLPSGAWADLLPPGKLKAKHVRMVNRAVTNIGYRRPGSQILDLIDGVVAILVQEWSCVDDDGDTLPIPSENLSVLDELSIEDYETLVGHEYVTEVGQRIMALRSERISPDDVDDPESPTVPSAESGSDLRAKKSHRKTMSTPSGTTPKRT